MLYMTNQTFDFADDQKPNPIMIVAHSNHRSFGLVAGGVPSNPHGFSIRLSREQLTSLITDATTALVKPLTSEDECPICHNGTLGLEEGQLVCRGECGNIWKCGP